MPDGQGGVQLGLDRSATPDFIMDENGNLQQNWDTRFSESRFDDQLFFADPNWLFSATSRNQQTTINEFRLNGDLALSPNSHAIQA